MEDLNQGGTESQSRASKELQTALRLIVRGVLVALEQKPGGGYRAYLAHDPGSVGLAHISRLRSFLALCDFKLHRVSFLETLVTFGRNRAVMNEYIGSVITSDETVALGIIEPLNRTS